MTVVRWAVNALGILIVGALAMQVWPLIVSGVDWALYAALVQGYLWGVSAPARAYWIETGCWKWQP